MSISTCPRCAKQVLVPAGVHGAARVRCPLCHEQYSLADALANLPPQLEVVDEPAEEPPSEPHDTSAGIGAASETPFGVGIEPTTELGAPAEEAFDFEGGLESTAADHDDFTIQEQDTEVEEFVAGSSEPQHAAEDDQLPLEFDTPAAELPAEDAVSFDTVPEGEEIELDFGEALAAESTASAEIDDEAGIDFGEPTAEGPADEESLDFGAPLEGAEAAEGELIDFDQPVRDVPPDDEQIMPDFGEPVVEEAAVAEEPAAEKGGKKKKAKKEKKQKAAVAAGEPGAPRKRSLVGTLASVLLPLLITVPLALYGAIWLGPDYDLLKIGPMLPGWLPQPKRSATIARVNPLPQPATPPASASGAQPAPAGGPASETIEAETPADQAAPANTTPAVEPPAEPVAAPAAAATESEKPAPAVAEGKPAADAPLADQPADESPRNAPKADDLADTAGPSLDKDAEDMPAEPVSPKADTADDLDSLVGDDAKPAAEPEDMIDEKPALEPAEEVVAAEVAEAVGPRDAGEFTPADVARATNEVLQANEKMMTAQAAKDDALLKTARKDFYLSLYGLANVVA